MMIRTVTTFGFGCSVHDIDCHFVQDLHPDFDAFWDHDVESLAELVTASCEMVMELDGSPWTDHEWAFTVSPCCALPRQT